jgi:hypothetical protein
LNILERARLLSGNRDIMVNVLNTVPCPLITDSALPAECEESIDKARTGCQGAQAGEFGQMLGGSHFEIEA